MASNTNNLQNSWKFHKKIIFLQRFRSSIMNSVVLLIFDIMVKRTFYLLMHILICSMFCVSISAQTQEVDDLQEYINNLPDRTSTRSCPAEIEVDLSQFSSTNRIEPSTGRCCQYLVTVELS